MRFFYDTEFLSDGQGIDLISIGIINENRDEYYAVNYDMPIEEIQKHKWLCENVVPHLPLAGNSKGPFHRQLWKLDHTNVAVKPSWVIANEVREFLLADGPEPELWAYYGAYDHVALCQLWGTMANLPKGIPMFTHELMQLWETAGRPTKPALGPEAHNALADARWNLNLYNYCTKK